MHFHQLFQSGVATVKAVGEAADGVVGLLQTLNGDPDTKLGKLLAHGKDPVRKKAVGGDDNPVRLGVQLPDDVLQVLTDEGLAAGDVYKIHLGQLADGLHRQLLLRLGGGLVPAAHGAAGVAAIGYNHRAIEFFSHDYLLFFVFSYRSRVFWATSSQHMRA